MDLESIVKNDYIYDVPVVAAIAIPKEMVQGLIEALTVQLVENKREDDIEFGGM